MGREGRILLGPVITRDLVMERARSWLRPAVDYSRTTLYRNRYGRYRKDSSGYVSMAWALPGHPPHGPGGLNTVGLEIVSTGINRDELCPGDVLVRAEGAREGRHVVLFAGWVDPTRTEYWGLEQVDGVGTIRRVMGYPYARDGGFYEPRRYVHITG
jgi:hypothetical protein